MQRRHYLTAVAAGVAGGVAGCIDRLPGGTDGPAYPGGTLVVENTGDATVGVTVTASPEAFQASLDTDVEGGATVVRRAFVTGEPGDIATLSARLGETGDPLSFQFLPAGSADAPPEVARLTFENAVEASATWTATRGTPRSE